MMIFKFTEAAAAAAAAAAVTVMVTVTVALGPCSPPAGPERTNLPVNPWRSRQVVTRRLGLSPRRTMTAAK